MAILTLQYESKDRLACAACLPADLILIVPPHLVAAHDCPSCYDTGEGAPEEPFEFNYIEAELIQSAKIYDSCTKCYFWRYTISYDNVQISEGETLTESDILGVFCRGILAQWVEDLVGNEPCMVDNGDGSITFTSPHGCTFTFNNAGEGVPFTVEDTPSVDLTVTPTQPQVLQADVIIDPLAGNTLVENAAGLYAHPVDVLDSNSIDFSISTDPDQTLTGSVKVSGTANNTLVIDGTGLYAHPLAVQDTPSVDLSISGTPNQTLQADVQISAEDDNILVEEADGLYVPHSHVTTESDAGVYYEFPDVPGTVGQILRIADINGDIITLEWADECCS
jgi:hypothetical protein